MAKDTEEQANQEESAAPEKPKKSLPIKTMAVILVVLTLEGAGIVAVMTVMGKPSEVAAVGVLSDPDLDLERIMEVPVLHEKFTNSRQGRVWIWDTEVIAQVKQLHSDGVQVQFESKEALIRTGVSRIIASAQHGYFNEPGRETLTRQVHEFLAQAEVIGTDAEGNPLVVDILIPSCIGFPADY